MVIISVFRVYIDYWVVKVCKQSHVDLGKITIMCHLQCIIYGGTSIVFILDANSIL